MNNKMEILSKHRKLIFAIFGFGIIYSLISLVNHYYFRTYALDLGVFTNALYDYIHFQWNDSTVFKAVGENLLADHFDLTLILFSPLSLIFGTYTLLIVQIVFILFGGVGVYSYFTLSKKTSSVAIYAALFFYAFFGVFSALSYDYHSNVIAATLVPWFFYLVKKNKIWMSAILLLVILVSKENISLWVVFICFGLAFEYRKNPYLRNYLIFAAVFSGLYFVFMTSFFMPKISNNSSYGHFNYGVLGNNFHEAIYYLISHPLAAFKVLFINHNNNPNGDFVKLELHIILLISGLLFLLKKPQYLFMLIPIYFTKLFNNSPTVWGIGYQYCIEFAPIMAIGIFAVIADFSKEKTIRIVSIIVLVLEIGATYRTMDYTYLYTNKHRIRFYQSEHYQRDYNVKRVHEELAKIPKDAIVSSQSPFLPHLSLRDNIYQFPIIKDAEYVVISDKENSYPLNKDQFVSLITQMKESKEWDVLYDEDVTVLIKVEP